MYEVSAFQGTIFVERRSLHHGFLLVVRGAGMEYPAQMISPTSVSVTHFRVDAVEFSPKSGLLQSLPIAVQSTLVLG